MERILCLGDSNTYGYDPRSFLGSRYAEEIRWTGRLQTEERKIINCGQNGLCIYRPAFFPVLARLVQSKGTVDQTLVMLGTNDLLQGAAPKECARRMETLLGFLAEQTPGVRLLLISPPPLQPGDWVDGPDMIERSKQLASFYLESAENLGVSFADAGEWGVELCFDGVHFSPDGHAAFARGLEKLL